MLKVLAFAFPLGLDSFAVAAALGTARLMAAGERLRISALFMVFEGGVALIGLGLGVTVIRAAADYLTAVALMGFGAWTWAAAQAEWVLGCHVPGLARPAW